LKFEIKNRWSGSVIFSIETDSFKLALEAAIKSGADVRAADCAGQDLSSANLESANLESANL
jgi:uncharacterized protein YjbI with pentapeptide repeats